MKKVIFNPENPNGLEVEMTADEILKAQEVDTADATKDQEEQDAKTAKENLKTSAKAKLVAGTPLTEEEANVMIGG